MSEKPTTLELYKEIRSWTSNEYTLIANRIGWLLATNAFLLSAFTFSFRYEGGKNIRVFLAFVGIGVSSIVFILVRAAAQTIENVRKREERLIIDSGVDYLRLINPDHQYCYKSGNQTKAIRRRSPWNHSASLLVTQCIPIIAILIPYIYLIFNNYIDPKLTKPSVAIHQKESNSKELVIPSDGKQIRIIVK